MSATPSPVDRDAHVRAEAAYLASEAIRLAERADAAGLRDCGDSCHQLRLRAERFIAEQSARGPRR